MEEGDTNQLIDTVLKESGKTLDADKMPTWEQLFVAIKNYKSDPSVLIGKTRDELRAILVAKNEEDYLPVQEEDVERVLASTHRREAENRPSLKQVRFSLLIGLTPDDLMGKNRRELRDITEAHIGEYNEGRIYARLLEVVAKSLNVESEIIAKTNKTVESLTLLLENTIHPNGPLRKPPREMTSLVKQEYAVGSVVEFIFGSTRVGQQTGTASVIECLDSGRVKVKILSAKPFGCTQVKRPLKIGGKRKFFPSAIRKVLSVPEEETGAKEAA